MALRATIVFMKKFQLIKKNVKIFFEKNNTNIRKKKNLRIAKLRGHPYFFEPLQQH